jgi:hypothetical protein
VWWKDIRVEVYGWNSAAKIVLFNGKPLASRTLPLSHGLAITIPVGTQAFHLQLR